MPRDELRREYDRATLNRVDLAADPVDQFEVWFGEAKEAGLDLPDSMALATWSEESGPNVRVVSLRDVDDSGFVFFTNYESEKGRELLEEPRAALNFHWSVFERQVRVRGAVVPTTDEESETYFARRPRGSQIGAWASPQSGVLRSRAELDEIATDTEKQYRGRDIPRPPFWGGYRLVHQSVEFWQGRQSRLHDRFRYVRENGGWRIERLAP